MVHAIRDGDEATVEAAVVQLSSRRRLFAPLGVSLQVGATSAVKAIKMSSKLVAGQHGAPAAPAAPVVST